LSVSAIGLLAVTILLLFLPETKAPVPPLAFGSRSPELQHDQHIAHL
jgi:hypothetical protein